MLQRPLARLFAALILALMIFRPAGAEGVRWLLVEAQLLPSDCAQPQSCVDQAVHLLRNYMALTPDEVMYLTHLIDQNSTIREGAGTRSPVRATAQNVDLVVALHGNAPADKSKLLRGHPGVYFDRSKADANELSAGFADRVIEGLDQMGLRLLSKEDVETVPGRPTLALSVSDYREAAGCVTPFSVALSITEEVVMTRDPAQKLTLPIWSTSVKQNLTSTNHTLRDALEEAMEKFIADYQAANVPAKSASDG